jgi:hypothetical protein
VSDNQAAGLLGSRTEGAEGCRRHVGLAQPAKGFALDATGADDGSGWRQSARSRLLHQVLIDCQEFRRPNAFADAYFSAAAKIDPHISMTIDVLDEVG